MHIYLDNIIFSLQKAGGISVVWGNLINGLLSLTNNIHFLEYKNATNNINRSQLEISSKMTIIERLFSPIFSQFIHPKVSSAEKFIFHSSYFRTCRNRNAINVTTVHDFIYEQSRMTFKQRLRVALNYKAIRRSDAVVCISENTKRDLLKYVPDIDPDKVRVIYNGVSEDYCRTSKIPFPEYKDYVLYVGGRQGYKNFDFVVKALSKSTYRLLICGAPLTESECELLQSHLNGRYLFIKYPSNQELNRIYNSVYCLAYPSSYEGFGLPVLEAQRAGCPVIAFNSSSIPEIIGDNALLMSELTNDNFLEMLKKIEDKEYRNIVIESGLVNTQRFSWAKMSEEYFKLYNELLD